MPRLVHFEVKDLPQLCVVGKAIQVPKEMESNPIPALWHQCFDDGTFATLETLREYHVAEDYVGWIGDWGEESFTYICGMLMKPEVPVPEGFEGRILPAGRAAVAWIKGQEAEVLFAAHTVTMEALLGKGYEYDQAAGWSMELYNCPRYTEPDAKGELILDYYIPVK
ncbi:MAG: GyrI-like domain-containing protein [Limnochordia bacterium]